MLYWISILFQGDDVVKIKTVSFKKTHKKYRAYESFDISSCGNSSVWTLSNA